MRYSCNDIFMVRTPSLPASVFSDFVQFEGNDVENFLQQTPFRDFMDKSILLSSRELYNAKKRNLQSSTKKSKARNLARIKFLIRACTRPTPYGLFAGAALGEFCENPNIEPMVIDERKAILECRADYSWLSHFIYEMENNPSVYPQLQLRFNNNCYVSGDRLKNPHHSNHGFLMPEETVTERTHMRNTPLITYVKQQAQTFIRYDLLKSRIQSKYPGVPEEKIISTINALMENEVLLSNLRAPANCENGLEYVLKILAPIEGIDRQKETLQKINTLINQMNGELEIDQVNAKTIESVYTLMDGLLSQKNEKDLLAVNKGMVLQQNKLPYQVKEIVEQFVEALTYLQVDVPSRLEKFKRQFQEEYGSNVEVPFCTIIDQNDFNGLSYLEKYQPSQDEKDQKIKQIVDEKILDCLQAQQEEINLSIDNFSSLEISREDRYPESFDINFFVSKEKEHYRLWLAPIGGSGAAGDMFNRFNCVLDADLFHQYKENNRSLVCSDKALITVEIREGSVKGRMSNVNNHRNESQYYIALATKLILKVDGGPADFPAGPPFSLFVKSRVGVIHVFLIQVFPHHLHRAAKTLEMHNFPFPQKANHIGDIGIIFGQPQNVVIGYSGFLFCCHIFGQIADRISFYTDGGRRPGEPRSCRGIDPCGVVHKIGGKGRITLNLLIRQISGQLVYDGCHHFQMPQLLCADVRQQALNLWIGHGVALGEIPQGGAQLPVRTT